MSLYLIIQIFRFLLINTFIFLYLRIKSNFRYRLILLRRFWFIIKFFHFFSSNCFLRSLKLKHIRLIFVFNFEIFKLNFTIFMFLITKILKIRLILRQQRSIGEWNWNFSLLLFLLFLFLNYIFETLDRVLWIDGS